MDRFFTTVGKLFVFVIVVGGVGFGVYQYLNKPTNQLSRPSTPATAEAITATPANTPAELMKPVAAGLNHAGGISFPSYTIMVPSSWTVDHQSSSGVSPSDTLTLSKNSYQIKIFQGATGGAPCLYPGDPDQEGPSSRFTSFVEFSGSTGNTFRRSPAELPTGSGTGFTVCMKSAGNTTFGQPTGFGHVSYSAPLSPDTTILSQMDSIVSSIK